MILDALHALLTTMPDNPMAPSLTAPWSASEDGLSDSFVARDRGIFCGGDPVRADDVNFSFERYRGTSEKSPWRELRARPAAQRAIDNRTINQPRTFGYSPLIEENVAFDWSPPARSASRQRQSVCLPEPAIRMISMPGTITATFLGRGGSLGLPPRHHRKTSP
jgi:hypothetical protein